MGDTAKNDITKDKLISKPSNDKYRKGWDRIHNKKPVRVPAVGEGDRENLKEIKEWKNKYKKAKEVEQEKGREDLDLTSQG